MIQRNLNCILVALPAEQQRNQHLRRSNGPHRVLLTNYSSAEMLDRECQILVQHCMQVNGMIAIDVFKRRLSEHSKLLGQVRAVIAQFQCQTDGILVLQIHRKPNHVDEVRCVDISVELAEEPFAALDQLWDAVGGWRLVFMARYCVSQVCDQLRVECPDEQD